MGKKYKNLITQIHDIRNWWKAYQRTSRGKRRSFQYLLFRVNEVENLINLRQSVIDGTYQPSKPREFAIYEPKSRSISSLPFKDRIVQHVLYAVLEPIFNKVFLPNSFACRKRKGTHKAAITTQALMRRYPNYHYLKTDFSKYFYNIDRSILWKEIEKKISCQGTMKLLEKFVPREGKGIPIGNLISQLTANIYGHIFDRWLVHTKGISTFVRYMDDTVIVNKSREALKRLLTDITEFVNDKMKLVLSKWHIKPIGKGVNFCGYRLWPTHKLIRKSSIRLARQKIKSYLKNNNKEKLFLFLTSWMGHIDWADSFNLINRIQVLVYPLPIINRN